jgi:hypothetical protein
MPPKEVSALIPRTCEHITLHRKSHFTDVKKVKALEMGDYHRLFR